MKKLITVLFAVMLTFSLSAQTDQGVIFLDVGGDLLDYTSLTLQDMDPNNPYDEYKQTTFGINAKVGYFLADGLVGGILLNITSQKLEYEFDGYYGNNVEIKQITTGFGPFIRYYFADSGVFTEASYSFGSTKTEYDYDGNDPDDDEMDMTAWSIGVGYSLFVSDMISISPSIAFGGYKTVEEDAVYSSSGFPYYNYNEEDEESTYSGISFKIGISLFLE